LRFSQRSGRNIGFAINVSPELEPTLKFSVITEQNLPSAGAYNPRGCRNMTWFKMAPPQYSVSLCEKLKNCSFGF
jgi:hypothetical protein